MKFVRPLSLFTRFTRKIHNLVLKWKDFDAFESDIAIDNRQWASWALFTCGNHIMLVLQWIFSWLTAKTNIIYTSVSCYLRFKSYIVMSIQQKTSLFAHACLSMSHSTTDTRSLSKSPYNILRSRVLNRLGDFDFPLQILIRPNRWHSRMQFCWRFQFHAIFKSLLDIFVGNPLL